MQFRLLSKQLVCAFFLCLVQTKIGAQINTQQRLEGACLGYDSGYVVSFRDNFIVTIVNETKWSVVSSNLLYQNRNYTLEYNTNNVNTWGVGIDYKWLTFEYTTKMPWYVPNPKLGTVKNSGFGFGITGRRIAFRNFLESSTGYFLLNTDDYLKNYVKQNNQYYIRPDIHTTTYFATLNYVFNNKRFSNNASLWQLERQQKRAGSFAAGISYIFNAFSSDSSIIPSNNLDSLPKSNYSHFALNCIGINFGYLATLPLGKQKKWFITLAFIPGLSRQWGVISIENEGLTKGNNLSGFQSEFRFGFGYNGDNWYLGSLVKSYSNLNAVSQQDPIIIEQAYGRLYFGYRFNSPQLKHPIFKKYGL